MESCVLLSWSGGKDCALALMETLGVTAREVVLLTTVAESFSRVSMHGVREALLDAQASSLGLELLKVGIPAPCTMERYSSIMKDAMEGVRRRGITSVVFGDIFLEDVRRYREQNLSQAGMSALFPLWGRGSGEVSRRIIEAGIKTIVSCVDTKVLDGSFAGREYDALFCADLPGSVDVCGENGEFHTFVHDGPLFKAPIRFTRGEAVLRENRFMYQDLLPA